MESSVKGTAATMLGISQRIQLPFLELIFRQQHASIILNQTATMSTSKPSSSEDIIGQKVSRTFCALMAKLTGCSMTVAVRFYSMFGRTRTKYYLSRGFTGESVRGPHSVSITY